MKITNRDSGVITNNLRESCDFYTRILGFEAVWESDWYIHLKNGDIEFGLLKPGQKNQPSIFQRQFAGEGIWISWSVDNIQAECERIKALGIPLDCPLQDEPWGERHFAIRDPNGLVINIATTIAKAPEFERQSNDLEPASK